MLSDHVTFLVDDENRENEGDLIMAAPMVSPEDINFMATHARGLICLTITEDRCRQLDLGMMVESNGAKHETPFTLSIEAARGVTTGISAADRAHTIKVASNFIDDPENFDPTKFEDKVSAEEKQLNAMNAASDEKKKN